MFAVVAAAPFDVFLFGSMLNPLGRFRYRFVPVGALEKVSVTCA
jgi:hypothetical protein